MVRAASVLNVFTQDVHAKGLSWERTWRRVCLFKDCFRLNLFGHSLHANGRSPVCMRTWESNPDSTWIIYHTVYTGMDVRQYVCEHESPMKISARMFYHTVYMKMDVRLYVCEHDYSMTDVCVNALPHCVHVCRRSPVCMRTWTDMQEFHRNVLPYECGSWVFMPIYLWMFYHTVYTRNGRSPVCVLVCRLVGPVW